MAATPLRKLLVANRGEIALRIFRTAADLGIKTVAVYAPDDSESFHVRSADESVALRERGVRAYLDIDAVLDLALQTGADSIHPGYGFLAENAEFARRAEERGLRFVGPRADALALLGDKIAARALARSLNVPILAGTPGATDLDGMRAFFDSLPRGTSMLVKAVAGGGGRGIRVVRDARDIADAWQRCRSEAQAAFDDPGVYVERFLPKARHIEVQVLGDGTGACVHFGERECTLQRRYQKVIEIAPSPSLTATEREKLTSRALRLAESVNYRSLGTFEFLMAEDASGEENLFFIEANPRIQVEHTVTEEIVGHDLVALQLEVAAGRTLAELGLGERKGLTANGYAIQLRVNMERMDASGDAVPTGGIIGRYEPPTGPGIRVDGFGYAGYQTSTNYDSLLAKLIVHTRSPEFPVALRKAERALGEFRISGLETNIAWLRALLSRPEVHANELSTRFIEEHSAELAQAAEQFALEPLLGFVTDDVTTSGQGKDAEEGTDPVRAPMQSTVLAIDVAPGDLVGTGQQLAILEAMKMEYVVAAPCSGRVVSVRVEAGQTVMVGDLIVTVAPVEGLANAETGGVEVDPDLIRDDLRAVHDRRVFARDGVRADAMAKRHKRRQQSARENLSQVCDPGSFIEYGEFAIAAQRQRRTLDDLIRNTTGDGILTGIGTVNREEFGDDLSRCALAIGDYSVLAGTQGVRHHRKLDRILRVAGEWNLPVVLFAEGGGGRPGDTERHTYAGISTGTFSKFAGLSGQVPLVGVVSGRCFAGNAALLGCCDVIIAHENSNIGMAGPAMIEGGGLGVYPPEAIGPIDVQAGNGVVDLRVKDEAAACAAARKYLSYFQGKTGDWKAPDQRRLRHVVPENRLRVYEMRDALETIADEDSVLELRRDFGVGIVTALIRIEGRPFGVIANNPKHLGGAIDGPAADKASRFMQLCDAFDIPLVSLCDTPGFMVGPEAEKTGLVRHVCRMFVTGRSISVPLFSVVLRKCYGLGAQAMLGGGAHDNFFTVSWPTGEFGPMGLEGGVRLGFRRELEELEDPVERQALFDRLLAESREQGKAISVASTFEIDAVIDPVETRTWILAGLRSVRLRPPLSGRKRAFVDTW